MSGPLYSKALLLVVQVDDFVYFEAWIRNNNNSLDFFFPYKGLNPSYEWSDIFSLEKVQSSTFAVVNCYATSHA